MTPQLTFHGAARAVTGSCSHAWAARAAQDPKSERELIADLSKLISAGELPEIPIYIDSPLAAKARAFRRLTEIKVRRMGAPHAGSIKQWSTR